MAVAQSAMDAGCEVYWVSEGRRPQSRARAASAGLRDAGTVTRLCELCEVVLSVCPPEFAGAVALQTADAGFRGIFADLNALAPEHKVQLGRTMEFRGVRYVDGGIIGLPSRTPGETTVFLSGTHAAAVAACFAGGAMAGTVLGTDVGRASALKILFAGYNKGLIALYSALFAAADQYGVLEDLRAQFQHRGLSLEKIDAQLSRAAPKAWRWAPEMQEVASALESKGLPPEFHHAAEQIYRRLAGFKDTASVSVAEVVRALGPA